MGGEEVIRFIHRKMAKVIPILLLLLLSTALGYTKKPKRFKKLHIGVKYKPPLCEIKANTGDRIKLHYQGQLTDGTVFGSTYETGDPIDFELGSEDVIQGWNQGLVGMCVGEKRKLKVPSKLGYGKHGFVPSVPGGASLIFETELISVNGKGATQAKRSEDDNKSDEL